jgi:hypothetical protein
MTAYAKIVRFIAVPHAGPLPMQAGLPFPQYDPVALAAENVGFFKFDQFAVREPQFVPVVRIVAIEAPALGHVLQNNVLMVRQLSRFFVGRHALMAL